MTYETTTTTGRYADKIHRPDDSNWRLVAVVYDPNQLLFVAFWHRERTS
jgi:hypothetical protein